MIFYLNFRTSTYNQSSTLIAITIIVSLLFLIVRLLGFDGLYGQDSYEYLRYSEAMYNWFNTGEPAGDYFWPLYYPFIGALVNFVFHDMIFSLSIISIISCVITAFYISKIIQILYKENSHTLIFVVLCFVFSPAVFNSSIVVMSDILSVCFTVLSTYHALKFTKLNALYSLYYAAIFATCAIMTRYASALVLFPFGISVLISIFKRKQLFIHLIPILIIVGILVLPHFYIRSDNASEFLNHDWLQQWSILNFIASDFDTIDGVSRNKFPNIIYAFFSAFHPRYFIIGIMLIVIGFIKRREYNLDKTILTAYVIYSLFLAGIPFQNQRFLILNFPFLLVLLFPVFQNILGKLNLKKHIAHSVLALLFLAQVVLCHKAFLPFYNRNQLEKNIANAIKPYQNKTLYSFDIDVALKGRQLDFNYKNMWVEQYEKFKPQSLILFNKEKFKTQWKDKNPMLNWETLENNYQLKEIEDLPKGWKLYQIMIKKK